MHKTIENYSLPLLEARSSQSRCQQGHALSEDSRGGLLPCLFLAAGSSQQPMAFLTYRCNTPVSASNWTQLSPLCFLVGTPVIGCGPTPIHKDLILTKYICTVSISNSGPTLRFWGDMTFLGGRHSRPGTPIITSVLFYLLEATH